MLENWLVAGNANKGSIQARTPWFKIDQHDLNY